jgi:DNA replication and repair protein RecF
MISDVRLQNFRSYKDASFEFEDGVNIIVGPNASGKTNLLEAILIACRGRSYRNTDADMVRFGQPWARIDAHNDGIMRSTTLKTQDDKLEKRFIIGGNKLARLTLPKSVPVVVFEPEHLQLLTSSPSLRREFIDDILEQTKPGFSTTRNYYKRAVAQRNHLLKTNPTHDQLFVWDVRVSELGGSIMSERLEFIEQNKKRLESIYKKLANKEYKAKLEYKSKATGPDYASNLLKLLQASVATDKERGFTGAGPHRDDIVPVLNNHELPVAGSRGETRTMLLALKLLEMRAVEKSRDKKPILLLDDVFSELDGARRKALTEHLKDHQTFITTTDADVVVQHFTQNSNIIALG